MTVNATINILMYDDSRGTLFAWMSDANGDAFLATINPTTGATKTLASFPAYTADDGSAVVVPNGAIYTALYTANHDDDGGAMWAVTDPANAAASTFVSFPSKTFPWVQGLAAV